MIGTRFASASLAVGIIVAATACAAPRELATGQPPVARVLKPPSERLSTLFSQALPNAQGKTFTSAVVVFPPDARAVPHRHGDAFVYAYVLDGRVRSKVEGEPMRTYGRGEYWVEQPRAHHVVTENVSRTDPARLLVLFVSDTGEKLKVDDPRHGPFPDRPSGAQARAEASASKLNPGR